MPIQMVNFMKYLLRLVVPVLFGLCLTCQAWASRASVTDTFEITLRTGPSKENKIISLLRSGQLLEILEVRDTWSRVRVVSNDRENLEGWVRSRYLISRLPWEIQARTSKEENARLKEKLSTTEKELTETARREQVATVKLEKSNADLTRIQSDFDILTKESAGFLELKSANEVTERELNITRERLQSLSSENEGLRSAHRWKWFITGALVLLVGLLIGIVTGRQQRKRKRELLYD